jgi:hypothetical protein
MYRYAVNLGRDMFNIHTIPESLPCSKYRSCGRIKVSSSTSACVVWSDIDLVSWYFPTKKSWTDYEAMFQGYLSFTRHNHYWSTVTSFWGVTIAPWIMIASFFLLVLFWLIVTRRRQGKWTWQTQSLENVDLRTGVAPDLYPKPVEKKLWRLTLNKILDEI